VLRGFNWFFRRFKKVRLAKNQILIQGIGGTQFLELEGDVLLANNKEITVFAVNRCDLPPKADILLGVEDLKNLSVSLDYALHHPGCEIRAAIVRYYISYLLVLTIRLL
jgi:hypothetical protein